METELKPCPFCGGDPKITHAVLKEYYSVDPDIACEECGYHIKEKNLAINMDDSPKENCDFLDRQTIRTWNTRPAEDAMKKELTEQAANYENTLCEYRNTIKEAVEQNDALKAEVERLKQALSDIANIGFEGKIGDKVARETMRRIASSATPGKGERMSNNYKACPFAKELRVQEIGEPGKTVGWLCSAVCDKCPARNPLRHGYNSVFNQITQSPEVLAERLIYAIYGMGGKPVVAYFSTIIPGKSWEVESEAIAATVEKLKEVVKLKQGVEDDLCPGCRGKKGVEE